MCDALYVSARRSTTGHHIVAKVGDRPVAECQPLFFQPAAEHAPEETLACTRISIPQVTHTNAFVANKTWWMWGVEMGVNDHGVAVTINAEHSVFPGEHGQGLLGNDLVRLALERGDTAYEAMHMVISLLEKYGQEGQTHFEADGGRYESAYFFTDARDAWKLETAGRKWIAKRADETDCIGNCYDIHTEYDEIAPGLIEYAAQNGLYDPAGPFSFAEALTEPSHLFLRASLRTRRVRKLLDEAPERIGREYIRRIFSDHYEGTQLAPVLGSFTAVYPSVCMHAHTSTNAKSDCSIIFEYSGTLGVVCWTAFSNACTSVFLPVYLTDRLPSLMTNASQYYSPDSLWWVMEQLTMEAEMDYETAFFKVRAVLDLLQRQIEEEAARVEERADLFLKDGETGRAYALLNGFMEQNAQRLQMTALDLVGQLYDERKKKRGPFGPRNRRLLPVWQKAGLPV